MGGVVGSTIDGVSHLSVVDEEVGEKLKSSYLNSASHLTFSHLNLNEEY